MAVYGPLRPGLRLLFPAPRHTIEPSVTQVAFGGFRIWGAVSRGQVEEGGSLGELVSKLGYNLHKSLGVVGSGYRSTWGGWGNIGEQWKGGEWSTEHPAPLGPGKKTPAFSKQQFLTVTISLGTFAPDTEHPSPVQSRWSTGHWVKTENMAAVWGFLPD